MEKRNRLYHFENHAEIREFLAQDYPAEVYLTTLKSVAVRGDEVVTDVPECEHVESTAEWQRQEGCVFPAVCLGACRRVLGRLEDYPAADFAVKNIFSRHAIEAADWLTGLYEAGDHLAAQLWTGADEKREQFTAKDIVTGMAKGGLAIGWPEVDAETLYTIVTPTSRYQAAASSLFEVIDRAEKVEGVVPARRHRFTILPQEREERTVLARFTFEADKHLAPMRKCYDKDHQGLRPILDYPAIDVVRGVVVCTDGRILAAHKVQGMTAECFDRKAVEAAIHNADIISLPREVTQMKGTVEVEVVGRDWRKPSKSFGAILVTAKDATGKTGTVRQEARYPTWYSIFPTNIGKTIPIDAKAMAKGVKQVVLYLPASLRMNMTAPRGGDALVLSGEDCCLSQSGSVRVCVEGGMPYGVATVA